MLEDYGLTSMQWKKVLSMNGISVGFSLAGEGTKVNRHRTDMLLGLIV